MPCICIEKGKVKFSISSSIPIALSPTKKIKGANIRMARNKKTFSIIKRYKAPRLKANNMAGLRRAPRILLKLL